MRDPACRAEPALPSHPPPGDSLQMPVFLWLVYLSQILSGWLSSCRHRLGSGGRSLSRSVGVWAGRERLRRGEFPPLSPHPGLPQPSERGVWTSRLSAVFFSPRQRGIRTVAWDRTGISKILCLLRIIEGKLSPKESTPSLNFPFDRVPYPSIHEFVGVRETGRISASFHGGDEERCLSRCESA